MTIFATDIYWSCNDFKTFLKKCGQVFGWRDPDPRDLTVTATEVRGLDHAFFFTLRDSVNFGDKDHTLLF